METEGKKARSMYFTALEAEILMAAYADNMQILRKKSNTASAAKEREHAWQNIADRVNA